MKTLVALCTFATLLIAQAPEPPCSVQGMVKQGNGATLSNGVVKVYRESGNGFQLAAGIGDQGALRGSYSFAKVPCEKLKLRADVPGFEPYTADITGAPGLEHHITVYAVHRELTDLHTFLATSVLLLVFLASLVFVRWHNIAKVDQAMLKAEAESTRLEIRLEAGTPGPSATTLLAQIDRIMRPFEPVRFNPFDFLYWTRGGELAAWGQLREVQRQLVLTWDVVLSIERIRARLASVEQQLRTFKDPGSIAIADEILRALKSETKPEQWKQLLGVGLATFNAKREEAFTAMTIWQTKGAWLSTVGLFMIAATVYAKPDWSVLFLMGAVGGLLSRLARAISSDQNQPPSDYGSSWTTLFLSPVSGALAGWFGFLLVLGFVGLNILDDSIKNLLTCEAGTTGCEGGGNLKWTAWAFAFILGFSERLFERLVTTIDKAVIPGGASAASAPAASAASPLVPAAATTLPPTRPGAVEPRIDRVVAQPNRLVVLGVGLNERDVPPEGMTLQRAQDAAREFTKEDVSYEGGAAIAMKLPADLAEGSYRLELKTAAGKSLLATVTLPSKP